MTETAFSTNVDMILEKYRQSYKQYFKQEPKIKIVNKRIFASGLKEKIGIIGIDQIAEFYNWRRKRGRFSKDKIIDEDYDELQRRNNKKIMSRKAIAAILGISGFYFNINHRASKSVKKAHLDTLSNTNKNNKNLIEWKGKKKIPSEWAKEIGITLTGFRSRLKKHGFTKITFLPKNEYAKVSKEVKCQCCFDGNIPKYQNRMNLDNYQLERKEEYMSYQSYVKLITELIQDSKFNLIKAHKSGKIDDYFKSSQMFLLNRNGNLKYYLDPIVGIDIERALKELSYFAKHGYKHYDEPIPNFRKSSCGPI